MKNIYFILFGLVCVLASCSESEEIPGEIAPTRLPSTISLTLSRCDVQSDPFCDNALAITGANMLIYPSELARANNDSLIGQCTTNQDGRCQVNNLKLDFHYLLITTPSGESEQVTQETPQGTNSFLDLIL
ncbi:MAG: hypothetical protein AAFV80_07900 [Bacteroidota bacterium]